MIRKEFDLGIVYPMIFPDIDEDNMIKNLDNLLKDDYFNTIEIGRLPETVKPLVRDRIIGSKTRVIYSGHGTLLKNNLNLNSLDESIRKQSIAKIKEELDEAAHYESRLFTLLSGNYHEDRVREHMAVLVDSIQEVCDYAASKYKMTVALEPFDFDIDKKSFIGPAARARELAVRVDRSNFGFLVDLSHIPMIRETITESIEPIKEFIVHLHIGNTILKKESALYGDSHPRFGHEMGENDELEVQNFLEVILNSNYLKRNEKPSLSFEVKPYELEESEVIIANSKRTLRRAWLSLNN